MLLPQIFVLLLVIGGCCSGSIGSAVAAFGVSVVKDHQPLARLRLLVQQAGWTIPVAG